MNGLILGKFYPFHKGHEFLITEASSQVDKLTILVCSLKSETISGEIRFQWVKRRFPKLNVIHVQDENPQYPQEHKDFWNIWLKTIYDHHPEKIDVLFTSEEYGNELSHHLNAKHICIDIERKNFPISGAIVREDPISSWEFLPEVTKPYFLRRVVITGPESVGKSTACKILAHEFGTISVPEYGRTFLENKNDELVYEDILEIGMGHKATEDTLSFYANKLLILDTDLIITKLYSKLYFQKYPEWLDKEIQKRKYDLYLIFTDEVEWVSDSLRDFPENRKEFLNSVIEEIEKANGHYKLISGNNYSERIRSAKAEIQNLFLANR
ncbi:MAG: AAA family ATPase [Leptospiraceae bacterium]|nr:AAA family ATPase [Leptospiraceae bacterium]